jgi:hypothetical protein
MALTGHVTTAGAALLVWYTHADEYSDGELATDALADTDRELNLLCVTLAVDDAIKPPVLDADKEAEREADTLIDAGCDLLAVRDAETDADADTLKPRDCDVDGDGVGDTSKHCTYSRKLVEPPQPQPVQLCASCVPATMEQEFCPRHDALTTAPLPAAPKHVPCANGPDGHAPVGLP